LRKYANRGQDKKYNIKRKKIWQLVGGLTAKWGDKRKNTFINLQGFLFYKARCIPRRKDTLKNSFSLFK
jgi:hypothetical protein